MKRIANGMEMLSVTAMAMGNPSTVHPVLLWDRDHAVLVDAGYPGRLADIREGLAAAEVSEKLLSHIIITHQDLDHIGGLPELLRHLEAKPEVWAHAIEKPYIQGEKRLIKITDEALANIDSQFPPEVPEQWRRAFKALLETPPRANVDRTIAGGDFLPLCGGILVIDTPGHTPGHISLYHEPTRTLIAGDALVVENGELQPPDPKLCTDFTQAIRSLGRLVQYPIDRVICYHGGLYSDGVNDRLNTITG